MTDRIAKALRHVLPLFWGNWISLLGTTLTTVAGNVILIFTIVDLVQPGSNLYAAGVAYLVMPVVFVFGLLVIAFGAWRGKRRSESESTFARATDLILSDGAARRRVTFVVVATGFNVALISLVAYKGVTYTNSAEFCGQLCHSAMQPEYEAYLQSPHARVACVECHIGSGASWFARSKMDGLRQVWSTFRKTFSRPIPTPIHDLRPARETCETCHWPDKFHGAKLMVRQHFREDETNTRTVNILQLHVGGLNKRRGAYEGIHWHVSPNVEVVYEALDAKRSKVGKVTVMKEGRVARTYQAGAHGETGRKVVERRTMDCVDCHNRPTHGYDPSPEVAVDTALGYGQIDPALPFVRKQAVLLLRDATMARDAAPEQFARSLNAFYQATYPRVAEEERQAIDQAAMTLAAIYRRNVFPSARITWGTYPTHLGHKNTKAGCFRCHDEVHQTADGTLLSQDCDLCHDIIAEEEEKPDLPKAVLRLGSI